MRPAPTDDPELWIPCFGNYRNRYEISNHGRVRLSRRNPDGTPRDPIKPCESRTGYLFVTLGHKCRYGKIVYRRRSIARLVLLSFHGVPRFARAEASHIIPDKHNNRWDNLLWETRQENHARMMRWGNSFGRPTHYVPDEHVREIRQRAQNGESHLVLARQLKLSAANAHGIIKGKCRKKVV